MAFKPGQSGNPAGRPKGTPSRITEETKQAMVTVLTTLNPVEYLHWLSTERPELFVRLWEKMLPKNIEVDHKVLIERIENVIIDTKSGSSEGVKASLVS